MLVLSRRVGEEIVIAGNTRVTVIAIEGRRVRIGVSAPPTVRIDRYELVCWHAQASVAAVVGKYLVPPKG